MKIKPIGCIGAGNADGPTIVVTFLKYPHIKVNILDVNQYQINACINYNLDRQLFENIGFEVYTISKK